jgi:hypothetical protein
MTSTIAFHASCSLGPATAYRSRSSRQSSYRCNKLSALPQRRFSAPTSRSLAVPVAAEATSLAIPAKPLPELAEVKLAPRAKKVTDIAVRFAFSSQTYEVHTWHLVMGLLQVKEGLTADILRNAGLNDLEEAFLEVLYCLKMSDALEPKAFHHDVAFTNKAVYVLEHAGWIARCLGHPQIDAEHILASLAFYEVFKDLFPDVDLSEEVVWKAIDQAWHAQGIKSDPKLLQKQARSFETNFRERSRTKYSYPALEKFEHMGPFA